MHHVALERRVSYAYEPFMYHVRREVKQHRLSSPVVIIMQFRSVMSQSYVIFVVSMRLNRGSADGLRFRLSKILVDVFA